VQDSVYLERDGAIATIVLNRPEKRNALNLSSWRALGERLEEVENDDSVKVVLVRGAGDRAFAAGADVTEFPTLRADAETASRYGALTEGVEARLADLAKPTIAMVRGSCVGGGCELAVACDLRVADESAVFGITPAKLGIVYPLVATKRLVDLVGPAAAKRILFTGDLMPAAEALRVGLVDEVVDAAVLQERTYDLARTIAERAQSSVRATKVLIRMIGQGQTQDDDRTRALQEESYGSADYREGVQAFLDKRSPSFT
jgi:enoyl-CoA hydratase/carnithine racemase